MSELTERFEPIRLLVSDVDGVMTDGKVFWQQGLGWTRSFHVRDGFGIRMLQRTGIPFAVITAADTDDIRERAKQMGIEHAYFGCETKLTAYEDLLQKMSLSDREVAYIGDDLLDLPVLQRVGLAASVPGAIDAVKERAHFVTRTPGGDGAVRELIDAILRAQGKGESWKSENG